MRPHFSVLRHIPEPTRWPILQYNLDLMMSKDKLPMIRNWAKSFKDAIFKINFLKVSNFGYWIHIARPEHIKYVVGNPALFTRGESLRFFFPLMGDGILTSEGKEHSFQKKLMAKAFSVEHIKRYIPKMNFHAKRLINHWMAMIEDQEVGRNIEVQDDCSNAVFDIFCDTGFGHHYDALKCDNDVVTLFKQQIDTVTDVKNRILFNMLSFLKYFNINAVDMKRKNTERCKEIVEDIITKKRELLAKDEDDESDKHDDLLSMLMKARDDETKTGFTDKLLRDNVFTLMVASFETTGTAVPWIMFTFAMNQEEQYAARKEINNTLGDREDLEPDDLSRMTFTNACIKEALRLNPPVSFMSRTSKQKCVIGGYQIPANQLIFANLMSTHRQDDVYERPDKFHPERYLNGSVPSVPASYVTFGYGPYSCIGQHFAMVEIKVLVISLLRKFHITADPQFQKYSTKTFITIKANPPITLRLVLYL